uniref:Uncharacterized protein n=1 Tax=Lutzomyia longipalpis TaxID=7200 RepID=A0A1B0CM73_LUTLO
MATIYHRCYLECALLKKFTHKGSQKIVKLRVVGKFLLRHDRPINMVRVSVSGISPLSHVQSLRTPPEKPHQINQHEGHPVRSCPRCRRCCHPGFRLGSPLCLL